MYATVIQQFLYEEIDFLKINQKPLTFVTQNNRSGGS